MSPKKAYQKRLPTILPPAPRPPVDAAPPQSRAVEEPEDELEPDAPEDEVEPILDVEDGDDVVRGAPDERSAVRTGEVVALVLLLCGVLALAAVGLTRMLGGGDGGPAVPGRPSATSDPLTSAEQDTYVESRIESDGRVDVRHWIESETPLRRIRVTVPAVSSGAAASASRVVVIADGQRVAGPASIGADGATYRFADATDLRLSYTLDGVTVVSDPTTGRALVQATSLGVDYDPRPPRETRVVLADGVQSLACAPEGSDALEPCGSRDGREWRAELEGDRTTDRVVAAVDLPQ